MTPLQTPDPIGFPPTQIIIEPTESATPSEQFMRGLFEITFIDVGQADAALVICDGESMLIDGGNVADSSLIFSFLNDKNVTHLDYVIATHSDEDHVGGLSGALHAMTASHVFSPVDDYNTSAFRNFAKSAEGQGLSLEKPEVGSSFTLGSAQVFILGPLKDYSDSNNTSIVLKVVYGETSFLFTGDMERTAELDLVDAGIDLKADVLKVGHHGSNTSSSYVFLYNVEPKYAVISCGRNNSYGHPHDEVLSRLRDADVKLFRTDSQGQVTCTSDGKTIMFSTERNFNIETNPLSELNHESNVYIGNANSKKLHLPTCNSLPAEHNRMLFTSLEEAYIQGYVNCKLCMG